MKRKILVDDKGVNILKDLLTDYKKGLEFAIDDDHIMARQNSKYVSTFKYIKRANEHYESLVTCNSLIDAINSSEPVNTAALNEYNDQTKKNIHLMVTTLCNRNCKYCCNKQYDLNSIPFVTDAELKEAETLFLTGGEPFAYSNPSEIAKWYKKRYHNIKKVIVYTNALELLGYIARCGYLDAIDGLNISIKTLRDYNAAVMLFKMEGRRFPKSLFPNSRIYNFLPYESSLPAVIEESGVKVIDRYWQEEFKPSNDSIFRRM